MTEHDRDARRDDAACKVGTVLSFIPPTRRDEQADVKLHAYSQDLAAILLKFYRPNLSPSNRCDSARADVAAASREPLLT